MHVNRKLLVAFCLVLFAIAMAGIQFLATGVNSDFAMGVGVGALITAGCLGIISRSVREL